MLFQRSFPETGASISSGISRWLAGMFALWKLIPSHGYHEGGKSIRGQSEIFRGNGGVTCAGKAGGVTLRSPTRKQIKKAPPQQVFVPRKPEGKPF